MAKSMVWDAKKQKYVPIDTTPDSKAYGVGVIAVRENVAHCLAILVQAGSREGAIGKGWLFARRAYPPSDGWTVANVFASMPEFTEPNSPINLVGEG